MPTAFITGGSKRIGSAIALAFANKGFNIALHYHHSQEEAEATAETIRQKQVECRLFQADLTDMQALSRLIPSVKAHFPDCRILINNASVFKRADYLETSETLYDEIMSIHLKAPFFLIQAFARHFSSGLIINMLDTKMSRELTSYMAYTLSKKALADLTRMAAKALGPRFRVNGIAPGIILPSADTSEEMVERMKMKLPVQSRGTTDHITRAALFLLENTFVTGEILYIDGGEHLN